MVDFDFKNAQKLIAEINSVVATCPEHLQEICFKMLFGLVFPGTSTQPLSATQRVDEKPLDGSEITKQAPGNGSKASVNSKLPGKIIAFMRRSGISEAMLEKLFILDHEPLLPIYRITTSVTAQAQLQKVMMVLLENGLLTNALKAPYAELRDTCKEEGLFDANFNKVLKRNANLFRGAITENKIDENGVVELSGAGLEHLANLVKELAEGRSDA
jgi:hypothetical protein